MLHGLNKELQINKRVPSIHKYIHWKLINRKSKIFGDVPKGQTIIDREKITIFLFDNMIPKKIHKEFLKELEHYELINIKSKKLIEILNK